MIVTSTSNRQRRNDGFSSKAVALKLILFAAALGACLNLWLFHSHYSQDVIHLTHHDVVDDDDEGWEMNKIAMREEWERPTEHEWEAEESPVSEEWDPILKNKATEDDETATDDNDKEERSTLHSSKSCLEARSDTIPKHLYGKLQKPYINLGFPKMGTSSLHSFFQCGGLDSVHYRCSKLDSCSRCVLESVTAGGLPFELCELPPRKIDVYAQLDNGTYFPQIEFLDEIVAGYPEATLFLTFRSIEKWYNSLKNWPPRKHGPHMNDKMRDANISGFPSGVGQNVDEFADWYCKHVERVRDIAARNSLSLVEVDIEDSTIAKRMSDMFGIDESCWGHTNANPIANPDLDLSTVQIAPKFVQISKEEKKSNEDP